jgi:L-lactate permease
MLIVGLAYLMNYSGLAYTLGKGVASTGHLFVLLSPFLGWMAVMLSGKVLTTLSRNRAGPLGLRVIKSLISLAN